MSDELIFAEERQNRIVSMLRLTNKLFVNDLCVKFSVSPATIRNDLNQLERRGLLKRTHGGAISCAKTGFEQTTVQKEDRNQDKKERIAEFAAGMIEDGDTVAIDTGTTAYCLAKQLSARHGVTVVTTDIAIANLLESFAGVSVILAGGMVRKGFGCTTGAATCSVLSSLNVDKVFIATNAVTATGKLCTPDIEQAEVKKRLIKMGAQVILICDSSKFGAQSFSSFGSLSDIDTLITDSDALEAVRSFSDSEKINIEVV